MKIVFFGSDDFALKSLEALVSSEHEVFACITQPDRAKGRGLKVVCSPIKDYALKNHIPVIQPTNIHDEIFVDQLKSFESDLFVIIAYGRILTPQILDIPKVFCINLHSSFLPKYRGAAPINWAIINGEEVTGNSIIKVNENMDAGEIISQEGIPIEDDDTAVTLRSKMAEKGSKLLLKTLQSIQANDFTLSKQDLSAVTYAPKLTKEVGVIKWTDKAKNIQNLIRGVVPWPSAFTYYNSKILKILEADVVDLEIGIESPGDIIEITKEGFTVVTGKGALLIKKVHLESSKMMDASSFVAGHKIEVGFRLG